MTPRRFGLLAGALVLVLAACGEGVRLPSTAGEGAADIGTASTTPPTETLLTTTSTTAPTSSSAATSTTASTTLAPPTTTTEPPTIPIRLRLERRVDDDATDGFAEFVIDVLADSRGWKQAGFEFSFDEVAYDYEVILAEGPEVDQLCHPYGTGGQFSCQIGPIVALNADRWRFAVDSWPLSLDDYRTMLVNHEVGHLVGQHHPAAKCSGPGEPAAVMAQQSKGVGECVANPWPLPWEIECASQLVEPIAPPYEPTVTLTCGPEG